MLAFSQLSAHNVQMTLTRVLYPDSLMATVIMLTPMADYAELSVNGYLYELVPDDLPNLEALQELLRDEKMFVYLTVIDMLKELAA
jgi:hypothetical protein